MVRSESYYARAIGCFNLALNELDEDKTNNIDYWPAKLARGRSLRDSDDFERAITDFDNVAKNDTVTDNVRAEALAAKAYCLAYKTMPEYVNARSTIDAVLVSKPRSAYAWQVSVLLRIDEAQRARKSGDEDEALHLFELAINEIGQAKAIRDGDSSDDFNLAAIYYEQDKLNEALQMVDSLIAQSTDDPKLFRLRGYLRIKMGDYVQAVVDLNRVIDEFGVATITDFIQRGNAWMGQGESSASLKDYTVALDRTAKARNALKQDISDAVPAVEPDSAKSAQFADDLARIDKAECEIYIQLARSSADLGQLQQAMQFIDVAIKSDSDSIVARRDRGVYLFNLRKFDETLKEANKIAILDSNSPSSHELRGLVYLYGRETIDAKHPLETAINEFVQAVQKNDEKPHIFLHAGIALFLDGQYQRSLNALDQATRLNPKLAEAYLLRSFVYEKLERTQFEIDFEIEQAKSLQPGIEKLADKGERHKLFELPKREPR